MRIRCIQHVPFEDAGEIAAWARLRGHDFEVTLAYTEEFPAVEQFDWLVLMGGPMNVHEERTHPWLPAEKALIREALDSGKRLLGVCLGAQLLADAMGARVTRAREREIGWFPVRSVAVEPPFDVLPQEYMALHWHGDTFDVPAGATLAATSSACMNQAFSARGGRAVGLQFHLEAGPDAVGRLVEMCGHELEQGRWVQQPVELLETRAAFEEARQSLFALLDRMESL